jgi:integrase
MRVAGKRQYFYGPTRQAVLDQFEEARKIHDLGLPVGAGREPLSKFLTRWLEDCVRPRCRQRTHSLYRQQVETHIIPAIGDIPLDKLTPQIIQQQLIAGKLQEGLAPRTVLHIRSVLRSAFSQAEKWLLVPRNVVKLTEPPRKKKKEIRVLTPEQAQTFVEACKSHRLGPLYCAMLALGIRLGEALGLKWEEVDLDAGTAFVRRAIQRVELEDGTSELQIVELKSDTSYRVLVIPASIIPILTKHRAAQNRERLVAGSRWQKTGFAFTSTIGTPLDERNVRREFYALLKEAKLARIRLHDLRHSFATILLATGEHPKVVQEMLGHSSVQLTLDTYSHLMPDLGLKERAAARLDAILAVKRKSRKKEAKMEAKKAGKVVSRVGIEPTTRRLRVCCSAN